MVQQLSQSGNQQRHRRSCRVLVQIPVQLRTERDAKQSFEEDTRTLVVNAHGALVALLHSVQNGQALLLKNKASSEEQVCRVVYLGAAQDGKAQVGVEFAAPAPNFWHIAFPPEDWSAASPEARIRNSS